MSVSEAGSQNGIRTRGNVINTWVLGNNRTASNATERVNEKPGHGHHVLLGCENGILLTASIQSSARVRNSSEPAGYPIFSIRRARVLNFTGRPRSTLITVLR